MRSCRILGIGIIALSTSLATGCGGSSPPPAYVNVSGKVVDARGKPIPSLHIHFVPTENREAFETPHVPRTSGQPRATSVNYPVAISSKDGTFALSMSAGEIDGAPPGKYRVIVFGSKQVPSKYQEADNSPLDVIVPATDVADLILKLD